MQPIYTIKMCEKHLRKSNISKVQSGDMHHNSKYHYLTDASQHTSAALAQVRHPASP